MKESEGEKSSGVLPAAGRGGLGGEQIQTAEPRWQGPPRRRERRAASSQFLRAEEVLQGQLDTVNHQVCQSVSQSVSQYESKL